MKTHTDISALTARFDALTEAEKASLMNMFWGYYSEAHQSVFDDRVNAARDFFEGFEALSPHLR